MKGIKLKVWKEGKRFLSMTLCAALIGGMLSGAAIPAVDAQAAVTQEGGKDVYEYTFAELEKSVNPSEAADVVFTDDKESGVTTVEYSDADYKSLVVSIPSEVPVAGLEKVEVVVDESSTGAISDIAIKALPGDAVAYETTVLNISSDADRASLNQIALMTLTKVLDRTYKFAKVRFTCGEPSPDTGAEEIVQTFDFAKLEKFNNGEEGMLEYVEDEAEGTTTVTYGKIYQSLFVKIPESVDVKNLKQVRFEVDTPGSIGYKLYTKADFEADKHTSDAAVSYGTPVLNTSAMTAGKSKADLGWVVVMSMVDSGTITFDTVTFVTTVAQPKTNEYGAGDLTATPDAGVTVEEVDGKIVVEFPAKWTTAYFPIPRNVNGMTISSVAFDVASVQKVTVSDNSVSENSVGNLAFKVMREEDKNKSDQEMLAVKYGNPVVSVPETKDPVTTIAITANDGDMSQDVNAGQKLRVVLNGISFTFMPEGTEDRYIEEGIPALYDAVKDTGISMGVAVPKGALADEERMKLVYKHFNSVTCENEMKPESILGSKEPGVDKIEDVQLNFADADEMMDAVVSANSAGKANIKVRGHVLVWHSQTPAWFFREGFKNDGAYVTPEVMNQRMKWYITEVLTHFSEKYGNDLFYAWDVVNEAADDSGVPRKDGDWKGVYGNSTEYITNAFKYADEVLTGLGDDDMILFYNDYNECTPTKCDIIVKYLTDIRKVIGAGRKLGAGMQGHHDMASPTLDTIENATRRYAAVADVVHITELDIKSSMGFDGVDLEGEFTKQGHRYREIFEMVQRVNADESLKGNVENITIWGTHDAASWLKTSNSVGGSADGKTPQFPLLFDDDLKAKPAYWAFVDPSELEPYVKEVAALNTQNFAYASEYEYKADDTNVVMKPIWSDGKVQLQISVSKALGAADTITVYADTDATGAAVVAQVAAADLEDNTVVVDIPVKDLAANQTIGFDVVIVKDGKAYPYNDTKGTSAETSKYYAKLTTKPFMEIVKGTACVDGDKSDWDAIEAVELNVRQATTEATATAKVSWDEENLYVLMDVKDANLDDANTQAHEQDSMELFIDELNEKAGSFDNNDKQYRVSYKNVQSCNGPSCKEEYITSATKEVEGGYVIEAAIKWTELKAKAGELVGIDLQINDAKDGKRIGTANWYDASGNGYQNPSVYGTAVLVETEVAKPDQSFAKQVEGAIRAIGTVSYDDASKAKIDAAKAAFSKLSVAQRAYVSQEAIDILYAAEKKYADLKAAAEKAAEEALKKDEATVADAVAKIKAIGTVTTDAASKAKIDAARAAYNALTAEQKAKIDAATVKVLTDAETTYKAEVQKAEDAKYFAKFSVKSVPLKVKQSSDVLAKDIQIAAGDKVVKWESSNKNIVSVTSKGKITGKKAGTAKITATTEKGKTATITVKVQKATVVTKTIKVTNKVTGDTIKSGKTVSLKKGKKLTVTAKVTPMTTKDKVKFTTSNKKVATVNSKGVITGKKKGTATITVKSGKKTFKFKVKVK